MRRNRVYLSKSKAGNFNDIVKAKNYLELLGFEVVDFQGGTYSNKPLLSCDRLFVLPPCLTKNNIGKGQFREIYDYNKMHESRENIYVISNLTDGLHIDEIIKISTIKNNWRNDYALLQTNDAQIDIINYIEPHERKFISKDYYSEIAGTTKVSLDGTASTSIQDRTIPMLACINFI